MYIAHIREQDQAIQSVREHLLGVQQLAEQFGAKIGVKHVAGLAGLLHDLGKYTDQFKDYIWQAVFHPERAQKRGSIDHSTAGGKLLFDRYHTQHHDQPQAKYLYMVAEVAGNAIISHHSYLRDFLSPQLASEYLQRVQDKPAEELQYEQACQLFFAEVMSEEELDRYAARAAEEIESYLHKSVADSLENKLLFLSKYVFSAVIDADRTNTRRFEEQVIEPILSLEEEKAERKQLLEGYYVKLMKKLASFKEGSDQESVINQLRAEMSENCDSYAEKATDMYTLSIPTGGGKTLASFRYGLKHAILHGKQKIIYIIPYTTILEQNAQEIRQIIADDQHLLEHHSNVIEDSGDDEQLDGWSNTVQKLQLAKDNWDAPIIFTTMVQFLNVFYMKGSRNIRRLHQLSEAVIIFDEVQKVPIHTVSLFNWSLNFLRNYAASSIVLCTATQPALNFVEHKLQINKETEITSHLPAIATAFKRVEMVDLATKETMDSTQLASFVVEQLVEVRSVLVILNTKAVVARLYELLADLSVQVYHLSTAMCPAHRKAILEEVKQRLKGGQPVVCVSTQLIEAGVDISFECVVRSLAGLDSMAQAAGRCNRHGEWERRNVYLIDHAEERLDRLTEIRVGKEITKQILIDVTNDPTMHGGDLLSASAIQWYFERFYSKLSGELNYPIQPLSKDMTSLLLGHRQEQRSYYQAYVAQYKKALPLFMTSSMRTAADHFAVIANYTKSVIVPYQAKGKEIIAALNGQLDIDELSDWLKLAQQYTVNLYEGELRALNQQGGIVSLFDGKVFALLETSYSAEFGVDVRGNSESEFLAY
ncbi:CRISPR-associated helicase Cas3' [Paenibacillus yanchengensis]|uniref:CRISPR-associated helicase Cas3 n=1 Tax=Paenibacillus yanchengensis TaxID=2035833 RepID=A0ABW4YIQ9_9BACL